VTLPTGETPEGSIGFGSLEDFASATGGDWILLLVNQITAAATGYTNLSDALERIASQIGFPEFAELLLAAFQGITGSVLNFLPWFINLTDLLGIDLGIDPENFNPITAGIELITHLLSLINPLNFGDIPIFGGFIEAIIGDSGDLTDLAGFFSGFFDILSGGSDTAGFPILGDVFSWADDLLGGLSPLNAFNLFGVVQPANVGMLPGGAVATTVQNLLAEGAFRAAATVVEGQGWTWDGSVGNTIAGSAKVVCDGEQNELVSNSIPVSAGDELELSVLTRWSGLSYTGSNPIAMGVTEYEYDPLTKTYSEIGFTDIDTHVSPAAAEASWQELSGTYTAPVVADGVTIPDAVRMRLKVAANLDAGTVWWDEAEAVKPTTVPDPAVPGIGSILDNAVNGLENLIGEGWGYLDFFNSLFGQNSATVGLNTRVTYLESLQTAGNSAVDLFERTSSSDLGADWDVTYTGGGAGTWATPNGHDASWADSGSSDREVRCRFIGTDATSNTDTQKVTAVLGSKAVEEPDADAANSLMGRVSSDLQNYVIVYYYASGLVEIRRVLAGVSTLLDSTTLSTSPSSGSTITLLCGTPSGTRFFEAQLNGQTVLTASDATSAIGAGNRGWGMGAKAVGYSYISFIPPFFFNGQATPGSLNSWAAIDN
jgi:hypothetical protein